ncbi:unnamed protein product [Arabidopsis halleri]
MCCVYDSPYLSHILLNAYDSPLRGVNENLVFAGFRFHLVTSLVCS